MRELDCKNKDKRGGEGLEFSYFCSSSKTGCSSVGRVHVWGACGRRFKSCHPDKNLLITLENQGFCFLKYKK